MTAGGGGGAVVQAGTEADTSAGIGGGAALVGGVGVVGEAGTVGKAAGKEEGSGEEVWGSEASAGAGARVGGVGGTVEDVTGTEVGAGEEMEAGFERVVGLPKVAKNFWLRPRTGVPLEWWVRFGGPGVGRRYFLLVGVGRRDLLEGKLRDIREGMGVGVAVLVGVGGVWQVFVGMGRVWDGVGTVDDTEELSFPRYLMSEQENIGGGGGSNIPA